MKEKNIKKKNLIQERYKETKKNKKIRQNKSNFFILQKICQWVFYNLL